jgi:DDE superfamily endonuclease
MEVTSTFRALLSEFQCVFTAPTYLTFVRLMTGWVLSHRRRFVTDLIWSSGSTRAGHHSKYHRFFSQASWSLDKLSWVLAKLMISIFAPTGLIELAGDDTLCRKRGLTVYGTGMHHDPLIFSRAKPLVSWGHDWVVLCLLARCPWAPTKVWALPLAFRLYRNRQGLTKGKKAKAQQPRHDPNHRTRPELFVELLTLIAGWFPERKFVISGDSAYGGKSVLLKLPPKVDLISHVHPKGALYEPAPPLMPGQKGRRRKKGKRLPGMAAWANDTRLRWKKLVFDQFGLHTTLLVKTRQALYYTAGRDRLLTIVLVRDAEGKRPDQMFYCTNLEWDARTILSHYACRWAIEVTFENSKQLLGLEDPANRTEKAVRRTAPMALVLYSLIVAWFHQIGHQHLQFPDRPWYRQKREPSFADMLTTLRRITWEEHFQQLPAASRVVKKAFAQITQYLALAG